VVAGGERRRLVARRDEGEAVRARVGEPEEDASCASAPDRGQSSRRRAYRERAARTSSPSRITQTGTPRRPRLRTTPSAR
jgi:hypothetical protein